MCIIVGAPSFIGVYTALFSMEKARRDFGFVPEFADFRAMMTGYKKDLDDDKYQELYNYVK